MRILILTAAAALAACTPSAPIADNTVVDEQVGLAVELAYQAAGTAVLTAQRAGVIPASARPCIAALDRRAYGAVRVVRAAHDAGNGAALDPAALATARAAVSDLLTQKGC